MGPPQGERNADTPEDERIEFRIGVNLSDVIVQDDDVFGDGVNVAARLEELAAPGVVVVSGMVHEAVRTKVNVAFDDFGPQMVKNIAEPVRAYAIRSEPVGPATAGTAEAAPLALPDKPSIAVLPFENMSSDPEQEYFSDGISEDIITDLSKVPGLMVIARNSTFAYKGRQINLRDVRRELGVRYALEGSVRKVGTRVRITAQLIDTTDDTHVWADRYDGALDDIFSLQDKVTGEIVGALKLQFGALDSNAAATRDAPSVEAYDHVLRARQYFFRFTREANVAARAEIEKALAIDPDYAVAMASMAECHLQVFHQAWKADPSAELKWAGEFAGRAIALDDNLSEGHSSLANVLLWQRRNDKAMTEIDRAITLSPNDARLFGLRAMIRAWAGAPEDAIADAAEAVRMDPISGAVTLWTLGMAQYHAGRHHDAGTSLRQCALLNPDFMPVYIYLAANHAHLGESDDTRNAAAELCRINPSMSIRLVGEVIPYKEASMLAAISENLRKAGLPE